MHKLATGLACLTLLLCSGCATIVGEDHQQISITSVPPQADVKIVDEDGTVTFQGQTPTTVDLAKSTGHYFGGKTYTVTVSKQGFAPQDIEIDHYLNGKYKFGNILFSPIAYFAIEPFHGALYDLKPYGIDVTLTPQ
jgi:hypothetical protein